MTLPEIKMISLLNGNALAEWESGKVDDGDYNKLPLFKEAT